MPAKKAPGAARYRVVRDCALPPAEPGGQGTSGVAGELVDLDPDAAVLLIRDGMVLPAEEGA